MNTKCLSLSLLTGMAKLRTNRKIEKPGSVGCSGIFLLLVANFQVVATSVTWTAPPPAWTQTDPTDIRTVNMSVLNGSTQVPLRWNYTLSAGSLLLTTFSITLNDGNFEGIGTISGGVFNKRDYRTRFDISRSEQATLIINKVTEKEESVYQCRLTTDSNAWSYRIQVIVTVPVNFTDVSDYNQTVCEGSNMTLLCNATGRPTPKITWNRVLEDGSDGEVLHQGSTWNFPNINRTASGKYRCTAGNGFGDSVSHKVEVNVQHPAKIVKLVRERNIPAQLRIPLECEAEGNPPPSYTWTPCDPQKSVCNERVLNFQASNNSIYTITCKVENYLGSDTRNATLFIASDLINVTLVITGEGCTDEEYNQLWEKLSKMIDEIFRGKLGYKSVHRKNIRCGSVIVDLALKFSSTVRESEVLSILRGANKSGEFRDITVSAITGTRYDTETTATMTTTPASSSDSTTWIIVGVVLGVVAALAVAGGVVWYVHKKRKCKKRDPKVHNNGSQGEAGGNVQDEGYVEVNKGHDSRANRQSGGGNTASVPAVLYDTARTGNRGAVKEPALPQYAVVDKSKKKPKKPKPGELQYAELAEFSAGQGGQRSSTSPTNRPAEIQYADVNAM